MLGNKWFISALLATAVVFAPLTQAATEMLDQVVAIVDDDVIMASELRERLAGVTQSLKARDVEMPPEDVLIRETLDRLILEIPLEPGRGEKHSLEREEEAIRRSVAFCKENLFVGNP